MTVLVQNVFSKKIFITSVFVAISLGSCHKNKDTLQEKKSLTLKKLFRESTYGNDTKVFVNDSVFCIYHNNKQYKVWKNGVLFKDNTNTILDKIKDSSNIFFPTSLKYQSEFMGLDFKKYKDSTKNKSTKDYKILKEGKSYFLYLDGYPKYKLPILVGNDMDWITFNSMDINNDNIPELFIFHEYYDSRTDNENGDTDVYEIAK